MGSAVNIKDTLLCKLADYYASISYDDIPLKVINKAKRSLVGYWASLPPVFVGELAKAVNPYLVELGGKEESALLCIGKKMPAMNAALGMGVMSHAIELDGGHRWGTSHPAVAIIPAVLAMAERKKLLRRNSFSHSHRLRHDASSGKSDKPCTP